MRINVIVNLTFEGIHSWPECNIKDEFYLANEHRHLFYIKCKKEVKSTDREVEIIGLKRKIKDDLGIRFYNRNIGYMSCEDLAKHILEKFDLDYCSVLEDNENGAEVLK